MRGRAAVAAAAVAAVLAVSLVRSDRGHCSAAGRCAEAAARLPGNGTAAAVLPAPPPLAGPAPSATGAAAAAPSPPSGASASRAAPPVPVTPPVEPVAGMAAHERLPPRLWSAEGGAGELQRAARAAASPSGQLILAMFKGSYGPVLQNWICALRTAGVSDFLVTAADDSSAAAAVAAGVPPRRALVITPLLREWESTLIRVQKESLRFQQVGVRGSVLHLWYVKNLLVLNVLRAGVDVLYTDIDVVFFRDPLRQMRPLLDAWERANGTRPDLLVREGNDAGLYYAPAAPGAIAVLEGWVRICLFLAAMTGDWEENTGRVLPMYGLGDMHVLHLHVLTGAPLHLAAVGVTVRCPRAVVGDLNAPGSAVQTFAGPQGLFPSAQCERWKHPRRPCMQLRCRMVVGPGYVPPPNISALHAALQPGHGVDPAQAKLAALQAHGMWYVTENGTCQTPARPQDLRWDPRCQGAPGAVLSMWHMQTAGHRKSEKALRREAHRQFPLCDLALRIANRSEREKLPDDIPWVTAKAHTACPSKQRLPPMPRRSVRR
eukprot:TRINITY_DN6378_c0_g1_i1.p1 TRINITY_DN6378_c0_g1~~TRINITY_DN6378_c0_g1_i1.p1  ORF type:complete len:546 (+),score=132.66 TRINITY_DN6378_c0_g1_i1:110-1747(+)